jgi:RNA polymerase sigma-70 factor (ECF subfamily)
MEEAATPTLDELLAHASWARALARELVLDEARADDVVQQAWLAAVERPPAPGPGLRAWLARLIRNVAKNQRRADARRAQREEVAAAPERSNEPPLPEVVSEFGAQQLVAQALLELEEPYRETLLRRWYRDEKPAAIARAMAVPVKTVETRLARGLERLRARLTEKKSGASREWSLLLIPLAKAAPAAGAAGGLTGGGLTMLSLSTKLVAAGVVATATVATWTVIERHERGGGDDSKGRALPAARVENGAGASAGGATSQASREPADGTAAPPANDPLAKYRGEWHLRGRVVAQETAKPLEGATVLFAVGNGRQLSGPRLANVTTGADGEFAIERLSKMTTVEVRLAGYLPRFETFGEKELSADRSAPPHEFALEARTYGVLLCRLQAKDGESIEPRVAADATLAYGPANSLPLEDFDRFEGLPAMLPNGPSVEPLIQIARDGDAFRIERAPARVAIRLVARLDRSDLGSVFVPPLEPGERREVVVPVTCGFAITTACVDATTGESIALSDPHEHDSLHLRWSGTNRADHLQRDLKVGELDGSLALPGPGHVVIDGTMNGFAPVSVAADVVNGDRIEIELERWRPLFVKVVLHDGAPWDHQSPPRRPDRAGTRSTGADFMAIGRAPDVLLVEAGTPLPTTATPDGASAGRLAPQTGPGSSSVALVGFEGFAPSRPLRVGVYDDGALVGSAEVPAIAPPFEPAKPVLRPGVGQIIPDPPADGSKPSPLGPMQMVTVVVTSPPPRTGGLSFRAIDGEEKSPIARYSVRMTPLLTDGVEGHYGGADFEVDDAAAGRFAWSVIPAGRWRLSIQRTRVGCVVWSSAITVESGRTTDLGSLALPKEGTLGVAVVDERGTPLADAAVTLAARDDGSPLEFRSKGRPRLTSVRTDEHGHKLHLQVAARPLRVTATSDGYEAASADVDFSADSTATCTLTLRPTIPSSH